MFEKILKGLMAFARLGLLAVLAAAMLTGCGDERVVDDGDGDGDNPYWDQNLDITGFMYEVDSDTIGLNQPIMVSGWVIDSMNDPVPNLVLYYSAEPVSIGYFSKSVDTTKLDGSFSTTFLPVNTGQVQLTVEVAENRIINKTRTLMVAEEGTTDNPTGYAFDFHVAEGLVLGIGDDVDVSVVVHIDGRTPAPNGTIVKLEAGERFSDINGDGYFTENVDEVTHDANENGIWDRIGSVPAAITTTDSIGTFTYVAGTQSGLVFIRATVGEPGDQIYGELALALRPNDEVSFVKMSAASPEIQVRATGGIESTNLTAYCCDKYGNPVRQEVEVEFYIVSGPGGGESIERQGYGPVTAKTNVIGAATVSLLSGTISGTVAAQALAGDIYSDVIQVNVNAGPPHQVSVGHDPCNVLGCGFINHTANIVALIEDRYSNPVADSTVVYFTMGSAVRHAAMIEAYSITRNGLAGTTLRTTGECIDVCAPIIAETGGGRVADTTCIWISGVPSQLDIYSYPTSLYADGKDNGKVYVQVLDANGIFVLGGTEIEFEFWPEGTIDDATTSDGCMASVGVSKLTSQVLSKDYSYSIPDDGIGANGLLTATAGAGAGVSSSVVVQLLTGYSHSDQCELKMESKVAPGSSEPIVVVIKDRPGNPLGGHRLTGTASIGWISVDDDTTDVDEVYTDAYGEAVGLRYYAPPGVGNAYITVTDHDPRGGIIMTNKIKIEFDE